MTPDGRHAFRVSSDCTLTLWDLQAGHLVPTISAHRLIRSHGVAITPDGRYVLSGAFDRTLKLWDLATGRLHFGLARYT